MLTAKGDDMDKILGLDYGADDYITKPFNILEVKARIKAIMRRSSRKNSQEEERKVFEKNGLKIDCDSRRVFVDENEVKLTAKEYAILEYLMHNKGTVLSRERIEQHIWNYDYDGGSNVIDVYVHHLRKKVDTDFEEKKIITVKGAGYMVK